MPKKSTRNNKVIRRTCWKPKSIKRNADEKRIVNNIYIGAGNARRWIILKKKLDYQSDVDFVAYLLDLAEPLSGKDKSIIRPKDHDRKDDEDTLPARHFEEETNDSTSSVQPEISDDGEWRPTGSLTDGPLRRSPRKQNIPLKIHVRRSARNVLQDDGKLDRDKTRHKEKKKKKEKIVVTEDGVVNENFEIEAIEQIQTANVEMKPDVAVLVVKKESEITSQTCIVIDSDKQSAEEITVVEASENVELIPLEPGKTDLTEWQREGEVVSELPLVREEKSSIIVTSPMLGTESNNNCSEQQGPEEVHIEVGERVKLKRRKKRRSHASQEPDSEPTRGNRHKKKKHKHGEHSAKKKHHDIRKAPQDGIPQDIPAAVVGTMEVNGNSCKREEGEEWGAGDTGPKCLDTNQAQYHHLTQQPPQRVAIKIKLCCDCNSRHVQDACPLRNPLVIVGDAVIYKQWCSKYHDRNGRTRVVIVNNVECKSERAMADCVNVSFDRNDGDAGGVLSDSVGIGLDGNANEQSNSQSEGVDNLPAHLSSENRDVREGCYSEVLSQNDDKNVLLASSGIERTHFANGCTSREFEGSNLEVDTSLQEREEKVFAPSTTSFAEASLPLGLELQVCEAEHGLGVVARGHLRSFTQFGPLVGQPIKEMDIPDDFNMKDIWEVFTDKDRQYLSTFDPNSSNWLRYIRPAPAREQRNVVPVVRGGELFFISVAEVGEGEELLYWTDDTTTAWSKKKMEKTNCGGCNLRFTHPLYYRMHCTLFHDPNFSLTIRKYHCKVCGTAVLGKENIMKHAAEMHDGKGAYQCQYCKKFFLRLNYLEMHRTYGCAANPQRARPLCDFCGRKFCQPQKLKVHIKRMHSDMAEVLREFQCKICLKLLGSRAALQRHMKEVHHKDIVGACTCDRCGKMFQNKSNLKIHMLTHSGVKPFKCKENSCSAAFTTKQCLQFHYKKVHSFSENTMPVIERSVAYTFDAYSGGIVDDPGRGKSPRFDKERRNSTDNNSSSLLSLDDSSTASSVKADVSGTSSATDGNNGIEEKGVGDGPPPLTPPPPPPPPLPAEPNSGQHPPTLEAYITSSSFSNSHNKVVVSKGSKKWMGDTMTSLGASRLSPVEQIFVKSSNRDLYEFEEEKRNGNLVEVGDNDVSIVETNTRKVTTSLYHRPESSNASLLVEAALDAAERDIDISGSCGVVTTTVDSPSVITASEIGSGKQSSETLYSMTTDHHLVNGHHQGLSVSSPVHHPSRTSPDSHDHMDGYALHPSEDLVSPATSPDPNMHHQQHMSPETPPSSHLQHMDSYTLQRSEMASPRNDHLHRPQVVDPYGIHHQDDLSCVSPAETPNPPRSHLVDSYSLHHQEEIMSPAGTPDEHRSHVDGYSLHHQEELVSPAATPTPRYELHHHQVPTDNMSSDEGEGVVVAQNLSLGLKEKALQLDLAAAAAAYKQYEALEVVQEFGRSSSERSGFEPLLVGSTTELQGLDMSARSGGYHHSFVSSTSQPMARYHHASVLYDMATERQSVDLSMSGRSGVYSSSSPPPYSHSEVLRVVSLDLTPGGRHSVDLSLPRSSAVAMHHPHHPHSHPHHHHQLPPAARVVTSSPDHRIVAPPAPPGTPNHVVPELSRGPNLMSPLPTVSNQGLDPGRMMSPPPHPGYQNYPVSPSPYHPPSRTPHITSTSPSTYHHYSGYY